MGRNEEMQVRVFSEKRVCRSPPVLLRMRSGLDSNGVV